MSLPAIKEVPGLWVSLSQQESRLESPAWHKNVLSETAARFKVGDEPPIDWDAAKRELRKLAE